MKNVKINPLQNYPLNDTLPSSQQLAWFISEVHNRGETGGGVTEKQTIAMHSKYSEDKLWL